MWPVCSEIRTVFTTLLSALLSLACGSFRCIFNCKTLNEHCVILINAICVGHFFTFWCRKKIYKMHLKSVIITMHLILLHILSQVTLWIWHSYVETQCYRQVILYLLFYFNRNIIDEQNHVYKRTCVGDYVVHSVKRILSYFVCLCLFLMQAEAWIKGKLQDLKDGCNIQRCPLQDWEEASQTLQRDLKDFENTLIQLNQVKQQKKDSTQGRALTEILLACVTRTGNPHPKVNNYLGSEWDH